MRRPFYPVICPQCYGNHTLDNCRGKYPMETGRRAKKVTGDHIERGRHPGGSGAGDMGQAQRCIRADNVWQGNPAIPVPRKRQAKPDRRSKRWGVLNISWQYRL